MLNINCAIAQKMQKLQTVPRSTRYVCTITTKGEFHKFYHTAYYIG